jgi:hypothetical protein
MKPADEDQKFHATTARLTRPLAPPRKQGDEVLAERTCGLPFIPPASGGKRIAFPRLRGIEGVELNSPASQEGNPAAAPPHTSPCQLLRGGPGLTGGGIT